jgi:anti-anti-sigma regulatory factor
MGSANIKLEGVLNIARVEAMHAQFEDLEKNAEPFSINASDVTRVDTSVLQLLVSLFRSMSALEVEVKWAGMSDEFKASAKLLGLEKELKLN